MGGGRKKPSQAKGKSNGRPHFGKKMKPRKNEDVLLEELIRDIECGNTPVEVDTEKKEVPKTEASKPKQAAGGQGPHNGKNGAFKTGMTKQQRKQMQCRQALPDPSQFDEESPEESEEGSVEEFSDTANERQTEYRKGGYHPVCIGDLYNDRYRVVKKLGWGYFSTVWLVYDYEEKRYQALKIQKSATNFYESAFDEIRILQEIQEADTDRDGSYARLNDSFEIQGPNGTHVCMVFDVLGENLLTLIEIYKCRGIPLPIVKSLAKQILMGVQHLHVNNIIHTDIKPENVLLTVPKHKISSMMKRYIPPPIEYRIPLATRDISTMSKSQRRRFYAKQKKQSTAPAPETDGKRKLLLHEVSSTPTSETDEDWEIQRYHNCCLADFGNSCWTDRQFSDEVQTRQYRSPEVILGTGYSTPIDIWSVACLIFELITGEFLFSPKADANFSREEDHLAQIQELIGYFPENLRFGPSNSSCELYFNSNGALLNIQKLHYWYLEDVLHQKYKFKRSKAAEIAEFLLPMLEPDPSLRSTAAEMLNNFEHFFEVKEDDYPLQCYQEEDEEKDGDPEMSQGTEDGEALEEGSYAEEDYEGDVEDRDESEPPAPVPRPRAGSAPALLHR